MATASESAIASGFLRGIGGKDTPLMRKAVVAWLRAESGNRIIGNNPWNMTWGAAQEVARKGGPKPTGFRTHSVTGMKFAVYATPEDGAEASGKLLTLAGKDWRGYDKIVTAARKGDPVTFLNALAKSAWDAGRYGTKNGGTNKLLVIYSGITGLKLDTLVSPTTFYGGSQTQDNPGKAADDKLLGAWNSIVSFPVGHIITTGDVDTIMAKLKAAGYFDGIGGTQSEATTRQILMDNAVGKQWNKSLQDQLQQRFFGAATEANSLGDIAAGIAGVAGAILNPGNWVRILALFVGMGMAAYGTIKVLNASGAPTPSLAVRPGIVVRPTGSAAANAGR